ncbi:MAG: glycoside hydrolase family 16 protein [Cytophagaceae bacterium]|jgi:beta-glucanase (GH16 family)|nr:glycoside hydrolase family 16 protein [Cytophagaceae bacterium]
MRKRAVLWSIALMVFSACFKKIESPKPVPVGDCNYSFSDAALTNEGWVKVFEEDFSGNLDKWSVWNSGAYNNELQHYRSPNLSLEDGSLVIRAKKETVTGATDPGNNTSKTFQFTSGRIESDTFFSASSVSPSLRFVARIKLPSGTGMWPAFWTYGNNWPTNGEIDILEARGSNSFQYATNYFFGTQANVNLVSGAETKINTDASLTDCYHVYEGIWTQNKLSFYLDGRLVDEKTGGYVSNMYNKSQRITLNIAVGGDYFPGLVSSTIQPGTMYVDFVKVFSK